MAYRNLMITTPCRIRCQREQLVVEGDVSASFPLEDLLSVLIESRQCTLTTAALAALAEAGVTVFACDEKHIPCALTLPFARHSRQLEITRAQLDWTQPTRNRWWQQIVQAKIRNQAECLSLCGCCKESALLRSRAEGVRSGDRENREATAAALYFPALFGEGFTRSEEADTRNGALNYGYAILRGCMARCLAVYGFIPWLGLHHDSTLNAWNLADDMMEPYRPVVDLFVASQVAPDAPLDTRLKSCLFNLLNMEIRSAGQRHSVAYAMERQVQSLRGTAKTLVLPALLPLQLHRYE
ncbi:type II CRISPR-associated endonuclease Cas1 [Subdoligranulum variabile]|uniref:type II CRISPR-associated endonuclease Cas1 n=1 Tax=Subdoligranulum variabile TaxID=214851 RepID=UPI0026EEAD81|nr:type II CRISPR-associated endonuclease Cas1 [Subdoligranulum variabile]